MPNISSPGRDLAYALTRATEQAALAAHGWIGRGEKEKADLAAVNAMRDALKHIALDGLVVIGEGEKDNAPALYNGEQLGQETAPLKVDIAVDPLEGTTYLSKGLPNALSVIAVAPRGTIMSPGPAFYMDKLAVPKAAKGKIDPEAPTQEKLQSLATALGKGIEDLIIYVLDRPRHDNLIREIRACGARVQLHPAGDVAGALMAALTGYNIDALMGTGGTPEGIMSAAAVCALGGDFFGRMDPQLPEEKEAVKSAGFNTATWCPAQQLVNSAETCFCATGITDGALVDGVSISSGFIRLQTLIITGNAEEWQIITSTRPHA